MSSGQSGFRFRILSGIEIAQSVHTCACLILSIFHTKKSCTILFQLQIITNDYFLCMIKKCVLDSIRIFFKYYRL